MDERETHEADQMQAKMRNYAISLAVDTAMFHKVLVKMDVPDELASDLTKQFTESWMRAQVEAQAGIGMTTVYIGEDE